MKKKPVKKASKKVVKKSVKKTTPKKIVTTNRTPTQLVDEIATIFKRFGDGYDSYHSHLLKITDWVVLARQNGFPKEAK